MKAEDELVLGRRPLCYCGISSKLRTLAKSHSFGRHFLNCCYYKGQNQCGLFQWIDLAMLLLVCFERTLELAERMNERIAAERARIEDAKFHLMKMKYKCVLITFWILFITLLCSVKISKLNDNVNHLMLP